MNCLSFYVKIEVRGLKTAMKILKYIKPKPLSVNKNLMKHRESIFKPYAYG